MARRAQNTWRQRAKPRRAPVLALVSGSQRDAPSPGPLLRTDLHECALNRWLFDFCIPTDRFNPQRGVLDYFPQLYRQSDPASCLHAAVSAVSYSNFHRRSAPLVEKCQLLGKKFYIQSLSLVNKATRNEVTARSDQVLMAVHLLGIYEVILSFFSSLHQLLQ